MKNLQLIAGCLLVSLAFTPSVNALGGGSSKQPSPASLANPDYIAGKKAIKAHDWSTAIRDLEKAVAVDPTNADAWNYLAFSYRKSGNLDKAFQDYEKALQLDPKHRGAYEYLGETYLQAGNLAQAQVQLDKLVQICGNCEQSRDLKRAIDNYKAGKPISDSD